MSLNELIIPSSTCSTERKQNTSESQMNIDETIARSRQIVQQSKSLTLNNNQRNLVLEERFKELLKPIELGRISGVSQEEGYLNNEYFKIIKEPEFSRVEFEFNRLKVIIEEKEDEIDILKAEIEELRRDNKELSKKFEWKEKVKQKNETGEFKEGRMGKIIKNNEAVDDFIVNFNTGGKKEFKESERGNLTVREVKEEEYRGKIRFLEEKLIENSERFEDLQKRIERTENVIKKDIPQMKKAVSYAKLLKSRKKKSKVTKKKLESKFLNRHK